MSQNILKELKLSLSDSNNQKSSHWNRYLNDADYYNINDSFGFGGHAKNSTLHKPIHYFFQKLIFENRIFKTKEYAIYKKLCKFQNRQIDTDVIRHVFTLDFLNKYNLLNKKICIIGDGKANFIGGILLLKNKKIKIFSINLTEVLIHDYLILKKNKLIHDEEIVVVKNEKDLNTQNKKLFLINASNWKILRNKKINLFVNIASMQEMHKDFINNYFEIIKSNNAYFYCCNREAKKLVGGEKLIFKNYPWGNCKTIVSEDCPWHKKYYDFKMPFIKKYDGNVKHALVKY